MVVVLEAWKDPLKMPARRCPKAHTILGEDSLVHRILHSEAGAGCQRKMVGCPKRQIETPFFASTTQFMMEIERQRVFLKGSRLADESSQFEQVINIYRIGLVHL